MFTNLFNFLESSFDWDPLYTLKLSWCGQHDFLLIIEYIWWTITHHIEVVKLDIYLCNNNWSMQEICAFMIMIYEFIHDIIICVLYSLTISYCFSWKHISHRLSIMYICYLIETAWELSLILIEPSFASSCSILARPTRHTRTIILDIYFDWDDHWYS